MIQLWNKMIVNPPDQPQLVNYNKQQWIKIMVFPPKNWGIYKQAIRTNNNIVGATMLGIDVWVDSVDCL